MRPTGSVHGDAPTSHSHMRPKVPLGGRWKAPSVWLTGNILSRWTVVNARLGLMTNGTYRAQGRVTIVRCPWT